MASYRKASSFLNEARLTKIGIVIRFFVCFLNDRQFQHCKFFALDDLLISLDLDNRVKLIEADFKIIWNRISTFYFYTRKGFFNELKRNINDRP